MYLIKVFKLIVLLLLMICNGYSQEDQLFIEFKNKIFNMPKHSCDFVLNIDVDFIKISEKRGNLLYDPVKGVDYKFEGVGFFPKKAINNQMKEMFSSEYTVIKIAEDIESAKYKIVPSNIYADIVLADVVIGKEHANIFEITAVTKDSGALKMLFSYPSLNYDFPSKVELIFQLKNRKLPASFTGDFESMGDDFDVDKLSEAKIIMLYSNYKILQ